MQKSIPNRSDFGKTRSPLLFWHDVFFILGECRAARLKRKRNFNQQIIFMRTLLVAMLLALSSVAVAQTETLKNWEFNTDGQKEGWVGANHLKDVTVKDGMYRAKASGNDPFIVLEKIDIPAGKSYVFEFRLKTNFSGSAELYYANTTEGPYGGFLPKKNVAWTAIGDGKFHTYRIFPNWAADKKIVKLRLDFPNLPQGDADNVSYELDWIRIVDLNFAKAPAVKPNWNFTGNTTANGDWVLMEDGVIETKPMNLDVDEYGGWISLEMAVDQGKTATLEFLSSSGKAGTITIPLKADGKPHWYNVDALTDQAWREKINLMTLKTSDEPGATAKVQRLIVSDAPKGPAEIEVLQVYQPEAINRAGTSRPLAIRLRNTGGETAKGIRIAKMQFPPNVGATAKKGEESLDIEPLETKTYTIYLGATQPVEGNVTLTLAGPGVPKEPITAPIRFEKKLDLPKASYVPEPKPVKSDYEIGALYYPGWHRMQAWERIYSTHPERKPVLGWYDEGNPEVVDWQIKWSVENGIQYYLVDWYWNKGHQHNDHWIAAFRKAKYRSMFKWAMMWANHNGKGSHSVEDQAAVTKFWIENYFNMPEYYQMDGRPVVMIWSAQGMDDDVRDIEAKKGNTLKKGEGVKKLLDLSQKMAKEAGYKGIYFIAMKWPEASTKAEDIQWLADAGFEMTSIYHFMHHGGKAKNPRRFSFDYVVESNLPHWEGLHETGIIPFLPNLSTGWDSRPWHGDKQTIIEDRTVAKFKKICEDFKKFSKKTGVKQILLAPTNEWGEGSYAEPNAEFGFGMFEAIRDEFCKKPANGWPINYGPEDVGLGPYDFPPLQKEMRTSWDFKDGTQGWTGFMGISNFKGADGKLTFGTTNHDPAMSTNLNGVKAVDWSRFVVRMKITAQDPGADAQDRAQLFWSTSTSPVSETNSMSVPVKIDGAFHDYVFELKSQKTWRRNITSLRFDPVNSEKRSIEIESIKFE